MSTYQLVIVEDAISEYSLGIEEISEDEYSLHCVLEEVSELTLGVTIDPRNTHVPVATGAVDGLMLKTLNEKYVLAVVGTMLDMNYWKGTQAQYDALTTEEKEDPTYIRFIV